MGLKVQIPLHILEKESVLPLTPGPGRQVASPRPDPVRVLPGSLGLEAWGQASHPRPAVQATTGPAGMEFGALSKWAILSLTTRLDSVFEALPLRGGPTHITPTQTTPATPGIGRIPHFKATQNPTPPATPIQFPSAPSPHCTRPIQARWTHPASNPRRSPLPPQLNSVGSQGGGGAGGPPGLSSSFLLASPPVFALQGSKWGVACEVKP